MVRVTAYIRGEANAQAIFDVMNGRNVIWAAPHSTKSRRAHWVTFDYESVGLAECFLRSTFHPRFSKRANVLTVKGAAE